MRKAYREASHLSTATMDFAHSPAVLARRAKLDAFIEHYALPYNAAWQSSAQDGVFPEFMEDLKALAKEEGLWNLCLPSPARQTNRVRACPIWSTRPWRRAWAACPGVRRSSTAARRTAATWNCSSVTRRLSSATAGCDPLLEGEIRSAFAMSEPDVASSDPTNLQTTVRRENGRLVLNGRKWFITGAAHPRCRLLIVMCRNEGDGETLARHGCHSLVLVPADAQGVSLVRNIPIMQHESLEGHCEILLRGVSVPESHLLGSWGEAFALAQSRLGPGRVHHCMRTIGQCELALELAVIARWSAAASAATGRAGQRAGVDCTFAAGDRPGAAAGAARRLEPGPAGTAAGPAAQIAAIKVVAARLQTQVVGPRHAGVRGDGAVARHAARVAVDLGAGAAFHGWAGRGPPAHSRPRRVRARERRGGSSAVYFTTPEQLAAPPRIR